MHKRWSKLKTETCLKCNLKTWRFFYFFFLFLIKIAYCFLFLNITCAIKRKLIVHALWPLCPSLNTFRVKSASLTWLKVNANEIFPYFNNIKYSSCFLTIRNPNHMASLANNSWPASAKYQTNKLVTIFYFLLFFFTVLTHNGLKLQSLDFLLFTIKGWKKSWTWYFIIWQAKCSSF